MTMEVPFHLAASLRQGQNGSLSNTQARENLSTKKKETENR